MAFDWEQFKANVQGEAEWQDADDLARMSIETLRAAARRFFRVSAPDWARNHDPLGSDRRDC